MHKEDKIYIYPTDTLWGIGSSIYNIDGHREIAHIKGTDIKKPISIILPDLEHLSEYVQFEHFISRQILEELVCCEVTLGFPKKYFTKEIPEFIAPESDVIGVRISLNKYLSNMIKNAGGAITTTSLNLAGDLPIIDEKDAYQFYIAIKEKYSNASFLHTVDDIVLSGKGSTFISLSKTGNFKIYRRGAKVEKIKKILTV